MDRFSAQQLVEYLANHCPDIDDESLDVIRKAKVSGKRAQKYSLDDWSKIGLAYGDILEVVEVLRGYVPPNDKENTPPSTKPSCSAQSGQSQSGSVQSLKAAQLSNDMSLSEEEPDDESFECLKQYFSPDEYADLSTYVKQSYLAAKENYEHGLKQNIAIAPPPFMAPRKALSRKRVVKPKTTSTSGAEPRQSLRVLNQVTSKTDGTSKVDKTTLPETSGSNANNIPFRSRMEDDIHVDVDEDNEEGEGEGEGEVSETQGLTGNSSNSSQAVSTAKPAMKRRKRQRLIDTLNDDELARKLPKYDIEAILTSKGAKGAELVVSLKADGIVYDQNRKLMMRTLTRHLFYDEKGTFDDKKFVPTDEKSGMAASVVTTYPQFADKSDSSKRPWWRIFNPAGPSGYIANCIVGIQRAMKPSDRVRGGGQGKLVDLDESSEAGPSDEPADYKDPDAEWMSLTMPFETQKAQITQGMKQSFSIRRKWIMNIGPSITEILGKYLHLVSYETEMLEMEFSTMHPGKTMLFLQNFPPLVNAVLRINGREKIKVEVLEKGEERDTIEACLFLATKLPRPNLKRFAGGRLTESVMPEQETLLACLPRGINVKDYVKDRREKATGPVQPYLLALVPKGLVTMLYIVVDSYCIDLKTASVLKGLDILFKVFFVFNVHFPLGWKMFWGLIENGIFKIEPKKLTNTAKELLLKYKVN